MGYICRGFLPARIISGHHRSIACLFAFTASHFNHHSISLPSIFAFQVIRLRKIGWHTVYFFEREISPPPSPLSRAESERDTGRCEFESLPKTEIFDILILFQISLPPSEFHDRSRSAASYEIGRAVQRVYLYSRLTIIIACASTKYRSHHADNVAPHKAHPPAYIHHGHALRYIAATSAPARRLWRYFTG